MKRYVIERDIPGVGRMNREELKNAAQTSNGALAKLSGRAQWVQSYVVDDKTFWAKQLLEQSDVSVQREDLAFFRRLFRRHTGITCGISPNVCPDELRAYRTSGRRRQPLGDRGRNQRLTGNGVAV